MYNLETQALVSISRLSDFWEQRMKPEKVNDRWGRCLDEEAEYWMSVFGAHEFIVEPESTEEF